ncbi:hypothetical protein [Streptomyces sp. NE5-10]|uniref:hypothetical protein n=1 Tax=Streptomyces sp. NE5-10 TaxID=2759674 RepID=UPI001904F8D6|nr:hypothetical protein [Streptomyces sp. NE5-10]
MLTATLVPVIAASPAHAVAWAPCAQAAAPGNADDGTLAEGKRHHHLQPGQQLLLRRPGHLDSIDPAEYCPHSRGWVLFMPVSPR